jgi:hypothetical protein
MVDDSGHIESEQTASGLYTETLARLYWRQGFLTKALDMYRYLAQTQPEKGHLRQQVVTLERQLAAATRGDAEREGREAVMAHLERWLHYLRRQRLAGEKPEEG